MAMDLHAVPGGGLERRSPLLLPATTLSCFKSRQTPAPPAAIQPAHARQSADQKLKRLSRDGKVGEAIAVIEEEGASVAPKTFISLLQSCIDSKSLEEGRRLHAKLPLVRSPSSFVETKLVSMYAKCGRLDEARKVFDGMRDRSLFAWSAMINGYAREHKWGDVLSLFYEMVAEGKATPDAFLFPKFLQACANLGDADTGRLLHSLAVRSGLAELGVEAHVSNSILAMYAKCGDLAAARRFFDKMAARDRVSWNSLISGHCQRGELDQALYLFELMLRDEGIEPGLVTWNILITSYNQLGQPDSALALMSQMADRGLVPDVVTWTSMVSGFAQNSRPQKALELFSEMVAAGVAPNHVSFASAVSACATLKDSAAGAQLHGAAAKAGLADRQLVGNALTDLYAKCGRLDEARRAFDGTAERDVFTWNSLIGGYAQAGFCGRAYDLFSKMEAAGVRPNVVSWNVMINGYLQAGDVDQAMDLFRAMDGEPSTSSWNLLVSGAIQNGQRDPALRIFRRMQALGKRPNHITLLSVLPACANLFGHRKVEEIHAAALRAGLLPDSVALANSLADAYAKSGALGRAERVFDGLLARGDVLSWNALLDGYVLHGRGADAVRLFRRMVRGEAEPDRGTLAGAILGCGLAGMVAEGEAIFAGVKQPGPEHCAAMVHLLGRAGRVAEAVGFVEGLPAEPDGKVWAALLTAARANGDAAAVQLAVEKLLPLRPRSSALRRLASRLQLPGAEKKSKLGGGGEGVVCCWVLAKNRVHPVGGEAGAAALSSEPARRMLERIEEWIAEEGRDRLVAMDEAEEAAACEKMALGFALAHGSAGAIRIVTNVRLSGEGHAAAMAVSREFQREVLLKDPSTLHRFVDGRCSCGDYW
ncbi:pentatricopeptide repeat (PPR-like) superfamily protein [Wolffia australiana]